MDSHAWRDYFYLRGVSRENAELREQIERMRLEQVRMEQDAAQARRIQALLQFKEQYISKTVAAQVIGSSGSETSHIIYIDRGSNQGIEPNMAVITPDGIVGKVLHVYPSTSQVLEITDQTSGVGATLVKSRLQGIVKGQPDGNPNLAYIMADETVEPGEDVITSGGDRIFPKGLPIGKVASVSPGKDLFLNVRVGPRRTSVVWKKCWSSRKLSRRNPIPKALVQFVPPIFLPSDCLPFPISPPRPLRTRRPAAARQRLRRQATRRVLHRAQTCRNREASSIHAGFGERQAGHGGCYRFASRAIARQWSGGQALSQPSPAGEAQG